MSTPITNENKNSSTALSLENKSSALTWNDALGTWQDASGSWDVPGAIGVLETKNSTSLSYENKN